MRDEANDFLMGGGTPWVKFDDIGDKVSGTIIAPPERRQSKDYDSGELATWPDGNPVYEVVVKLQTTLRDPEIEDDEGIRQFVINSGAKRAAVRDAISKAKARGLSEGGRLTVTYTHDGEPKKRGYRGPKQFTAVYEPPVVGVDGDDDPPF